MFSQYLKSPQPAVEDAYEEGKERFRRSTALPLLRREAKPPRWPQHTAPAWSRCVLKLDLGTVWVSQAEGLSNRRKALPTVSLPRNSHFVHLDKLLPCRKKCHFSFMSWGQGHNVFWFSVNTRKLLNYFTNLMLPEVNMQICYCC